MFPIEYFIGLVLIGICAGFASGLLGVGGGFLIVPLQYFLLKYIGVEPDLAMLISLATSLAIIIPTSLSGAYRHTRSMDNIIKPGLRLGVFGIIGGVLGGFVASGLPSRMLEIIFGCLLLFIAVNNIVNINKEREDARIPFNLISTGIIGFLVGFSSGLLGVSPQLSYYHKNVFRGGEWLNLSFMGNFQFKLQDDVRSNEFGVSGGLSLPKFLFLPYRIFKGNIPRTDFNLSYNYQSRPEYTRNIISTSYGYNGNIGNRFFYQVYPVQMNIVKLFDLDEDFYQTLTNDPFLRNAYQNHFDLGSGALLYYTTNSSANPQDTYFYSRLQLDVAGNILRAFTPLMEKDSNGSGMIWKTPFSQFVRAELTLGRTWVFGKNSNQSVAARFLAGAGFAYGNSSALPFEKHFYGGGANSLRGWQARTVGPGCSPRDTTFVIPNQTGDMKLEANIEYRFNMFWKVDGAVFMDAGNVWTLKSNETDDESVFNISSLGQSIAANWGAGVRLDLGFLLLRVDMGMKIHDPARSERWVGPKKWFRNDGFALHFGVGYPF